jgi:carbonic anhydrase
MATTSNCDCLTHSGLGRRGLLGFATLAAAGIALRPVISLAQSSSNYRAMLLSCVDPRTQRPIADWMDQPAPESHTISLTDKYSQFTVAGATIGVIAPAFAAWRKTFWENLAASIQLHDIRTLVAVGHGNCGALGIAYGQRVLDDPKLQLAAQTADAKQLQQELAVRHPDVELQAWYLDRDSQGSFTKWTSLVAGPVIN